MSCVAALCLALSACGRLGFDAGGTRGDGSPGEDGAPGDAGDGDAGTSTARRIIRSIGPGTLDPLTDGALLGAIQVQAGRVQANFPNKVGVGDVIVFGGTTVAFIHARDPSQLPPIYEVRTASGEITQDTVLTTDWAIYRAYTSLQDAIDGDENSNIPASARDFDVSDGGRDMVANDERWEFALYADAAETKARLENWTSGPDHYMRIFVPYLPTQVGETQRHAGVWDATKARMISDDYFGTLNNENQATALNHVRIEGLQIANTRTIVDDGNGGGINLDDFDIGSAEDGEVFISHCVIRNTGVSFDNIEQAGIWVNGPQLRRLVVFNNVIETFGYGINWFMSDGSTTEIYNNTIIGQTEVGLLVRGASTNTVRIINNLIQQTGGAAYASNADNGLVIDAFSNLTDDASAPGIGSITNTTLTFVDAAGSNYRLAPGDTAAIGAGVDLSTGSQFQFSTDITGAQRTTWDIGAFAR